MPRLAVKERKRAALGYVAIGNVTQNFPVGTNQGPVQQEPAIPIIQAPVPQATAIPIPQAPVGRANRILWAPEPPCVWYDPIPKAILNLRLCANYNKRQNGYCFGAPSAPPPHMFG